MLHLKTPLVFHPILFPEKKLDLYLKMECFQPCGSFKIRGIGQLCAHYVEQGTLGFLSSSGGNAGLAVAYAGKKMGVPTTIIVPHTTAEAVCTRIRALGAEVMRYGTVWDESDRYARRYAAQQNLSYIHPFDDPIIWSGHSSMISELKTQGPKPDVIICSVGGGGLLCGIMEGLYQNEWSDVDVVAVETLGAASLQASVQAGELIAIDEIKTVAKSLGARMVAAEALRWTREHPIQCVQVSDRQAVEACLYLESCMRVLVEPACGAAYAALSLAHPVIQKAQTIAVILCGGSGVSSELLMAWKKELDS